MGLLDGLSRLANKAVDEAEELGRDVVQAGERVVKRVVEGMSSAASAGSTSVGSTWSGGNSSWSGGPAGPGTSKGLPIPSMRPRPQTSRGLAVSRFFSALPTSKGLLIPSMAPRVPSSKGLPIPSMVPVVPTSKGLPILSMRPRAENIAVAKAVMRANRIAAATSRLGGAMTNAAGKIDTGRDWGIVGDVAGGIGSGLKWTGNAAWDAGGYGLRAATGTSRVLDVPGSMAANVAYLATTPKSMFTPFAYVNNNLGDPMGLDAKMQFVNDVATAGGLLRRFDFGPDAVLAGRLFRRADAIGNATSVYKLDRDTYKFWHRQGSDAEDVAMGWVGLMPGIGEATSVLDLWARSRKPWEIAGPRMEYDSFLDMLRGKGRLVTRAGGGRVGHGETTLVGERGPEIVRLPTGADTAARRSRGSLGQPGAGGSARQQARRDMHIHQQLDGREIARSTVRNLDDDEQWGRR
ncbi:hypothetical protein VSS74_25140 [Conexibacter stalactiti]|uniref:Uncharacterized protein n=1 Tax=Conexibacter stalactiti TaxID=1940611 RepID=A0ABU4HWF5_9ACTN|nr:hypothetical protein [Conexibacter stalactiti]MDW5597661.1 hypothetical protein [Conexibacter stalactiti]MEC5038303.1 hypothetical protein [Conexibacter stalactiti]